MTDRVKYARIKDLLILIKKDWKKKKESNVNVEELYGYYQPLVYKIVRQLCFIYKCEAEHVEMKDMCKSFFLELVWQYDTKSCVHFTRYLRRKLYFRLKNFYEVEQRYLINDDEPYEVEGNVYRRAKSLIGKRIKKNKKSKCKQLKKIHTKYQMHLDTISEGKLDKQAVVVHKENESKRLIKKESWGHILRELKEKEVDFLLCSKLFDLKQREVARIFCTVQTAISRMQKKVYQKVKEIVSEMPREVYET